MITCAALRKTILIVLTVLLSLPVIAQSDPVATHPMLDLLSYVPDTPEVRSAFYYADIHTSIETRFGTRQFTDSQEWEMFADAQDIWRAALPHVMPVFHDRFLLMVEDAGATTGINYFNIQRIAWFGQDESYGVVLQGDFDNKEIATAYTARGWEVVHSDESMDILCSTDGCEEGSAIDFDYQNNANPFGGELGRREPIALLDNYILNAMEIDTLETMLGTIDGSQTSLAAAGDVQVAIGAINEYGSIRQVAIFNHADLIENSLPLTIEPELREQTIEQLADVPVANLLLLVDTANPLFEAGHLVLVYKNRDDAVTAQTALTHNLSPYSNIALTHNWSVQGLLETWGIIQPVRLIEDEKRDYYVVRVTVQNTLTIGTAQLNNGDLIPSGMQFRLLLEMVQRGDVHWFAFAHDA